MAKTQYYAISAAINFMVILGTTRTLYDPIETPYAKEKPIEPNHRHSKNTGIENKIK